MGMFLPELSLDFRPNSVPKTISEFLKEISLIGGNGSEKVSKIDDFVKRLQEEKRKIDAFKRELPICMILLNDAIEILKEETEQCNKPVMEEFIPLKRDWDDKIEKLRKDEDCRDKKNWMSSVQLWNIDDSKHKSKVQNKVNGFAIEDSFQSCKRRDREIAFVPLKEWCGFPVTMVRKEDQEGLLDHGLSLVTPGIKNTGEESGSCGSKSSCSQAVSPFARNVQSNLRTEPQQQTCRKRRRCWSQDLHWQFISALQQLGGPQVATPKQIREHMQVNGLTNDEVKSHLQKYRLHALKIPATTTSPLANQSRVVYGNTWMSQDNPSKPSSSQSNSPQGPFQLLGTGGGTSTTGGDSMDADDDDKSETYSFKSHINKPMKDDG